LTEERRSTDGMLGKGLRLLVALGDHPEGAGVSQLAREVEVPVSTAHRLLAGMVPLGFVSFDRERRRYSLGLRTLELGQRVASARRLSDVALPAMRRVTQATGETTLLAVLSGDDVLYVERTECKHLAQIWGAPGVRGSPHYTSLGKCLVAFLPEEEREELLARLRLERLTPRTITDTEELREELLLTRERGYATNDEEHEEGVRAVGVPVIGRRAAAAAALSVATLTFRYSMEELEGFVPLLREAAREVEAQLR
jgi:IclR family transcriptional regulator, acetate operon repressor